MVKLFLAAILVASWLVQCDGGAGSDSFAPIGPDGCPLGVDTVAPRGTEPGSAKVGVTGALGEAAMYLANAEGYFSAEGIHVELVNFDTSSRMVPALAAGQLDVASGSIGPGLFNVARSDLCIKMVAAQGREDTAANGVFLFIRKDLIDDGHVASYHDLKGLKLAVAARDSSSEYALAKALEAGGLSSADAHITQMSYPSILAALGGRTIDGAVLPESIATSAEQRDLGVRWKPVADVAPGVQFGAVLFAPQFTARRELAVRWMTAYLRGARDYNDAFFRNIRRDEVVALLARESPLKDTRIYDEMSYPMIDPNGALNLDSIADQLSWYVANGEMHHGMDLSRVVDQSIARSAVDRLGLYPNP